MAETQRDIAEYQSDHDLIVRVDERTLTISENINKLTANLERKTDDHETRIRTNEKDITEIKTTSRVWRYGLSVALAIVAIVTTLISVFHK